jgi:hypothetical protein
MKPHRKQKNQPPRPAPISPNLRDQILADFTTLRVPMSAEQLDAALQDVEQNGRSHLEFLHRLLTDQAGLRRQRRIERLIKDANFREALPLRSRAANRLPPHSRGVSRTGPSTSMPHHQGFRFRCVPFRWWIAEAPYRQI